MAAGIDGKTVALKAAGLAATVALAICLNISGIVVQKEKRGKVACSKEKFSKVEKWKCRKSAGRREWYKEKEVPGFRDKRRWI